MSPSRLVSRSSLAGVVIELVSLSMLVLLLVVVFPLPYLLHPRRRVASIRPLPIMGTPAAELLEGNN